MNVNYSNMDRQQFIDQMKEDGWVIYPKHETNGVAMLKLVKTSAKCAHNQELPGIWAEVNVYGRYIKVEVRGGLPDGTDSSISNWFGSFDMETVNVFVARCLVAWEVMVVASSDTPVTPYY